MTSIINQIANDTNISAEFKNAISGDTHTHNYHTEDMCLELNCTYNRVENNTDHVVADIGIGQFIRRENLGDTLEDFEIQSATIIEMFEAPCNIEMPEEALQKFIDNNYDYVQTDILEGEL